MTESKRYYSPKTTKILFALGGNQCAHPECTTPIIEPATEHSDAVVVANICHIYANSSDGPRGIPGLTRAELNSPDNLILFCRNHHAVVDGQHETYPAELLKNWKQKHESRIQAQLATNSENVQPDVFYQRCFPTDLVDQKITDEITILRKSRFFGEFDKAGKSLSLGRRLMEGELAGGTDVARSRALSWCARVLSITDELDVAEEYLELAKRLASNREVDIANAFIISKKGDKRTALNALANINSPAARSAALMIVTHHDGVPSGLGWLRDAAIGAAGLDADGKLFLLLSQLGTGCWDEARETIDTLAAQDFDTSPVLHHMTAITHLIGTAPKECRALVCDQLPFNAARFPLASDPSAICARRTAVGHFLHAAAAARQLELLRAAETDEDYALWIELRDPEHSDDGRRRLEEKLRDMKSALRLVPLGLQFGIKLDVAAVDQEIERQIALHGGMTPHAAIARFHLAFAEKTPVDAANYIAQHFDELSKHLNSKSIRTLQIELLSRANFPKRANECLKVLLEEGLSAPEESSLRSVIAQAEGKDPMEARLGQFERSDALDDLVALVDELGTRSDWALLCDYGSLLFERTRSINDAECFATALINTGRNDELLEFFREHADLLSQSRTLQMHYTAALNADGAFTEARAALSKLSDDKGAPNYRVLQVRLGIAMGDWDSLSVFVANEYHDRENRSAHDLMLAAQLALHLGGPYAKDLTFAAAAKGSDDPAVLAAAYFLASSAGWETNPEVIRWLQKAAELSGDDGPIRKMTLKDLVDSQPHWYRRASETWNLLRRGEIPMFDAARLLNRSLIELMLVPAFANVSESDPRRRSVIPANSGKREPVRFDTAGATIGLDATALITLSHLNLLDKAFDAFDTVYIPHRTLTWLFEEKQRAAFHQANRIKDAHELRDLLAREVLDRVVPSTVADSDLTDQVGDDLASLIAEAEMPRDDNHVQRLIVRSSPVHRVSSLLEEEADLSEHSGVITSCLSVVERLHDKGQVTAEEVNRSRAFLQLHEKRWPNEPEILDGAVLYLDDLTVNYLLHLGLLGKLRGASIRPFVSPRRVSEADSLIAYESISERVNEAIERIRSAINVRIESGGIKVGRQYGPNEPQKESISQHPTLGVTTLAAECDAVVSDDRCLNQHSKVDYGCAQLPIVSTVNLLDALALSGAISAGALFEYRTLLRRSGYFFVPVSEDELATHLYASRVTDGVVVETAELKSIRENLLQVRMTDWLQLPKEETWLSSTLMAFIGVLKDLWTDGADRCIVTARSDWIIGQIDFRGWAHRFPPEVGDHLVNTGRGASIFVLLAAPAGVTQAVREAYWQWVEHRVLVPIKEQFPNLYSWVVEQHREQISSIAAIKLGEEEAT